jgi:hypothetical protein
LLTEIAQISGEDQSYGVFGAASVFQGRRGLVGKLSQDTINPRPIQLVDAHQIAAHQIKPHRCDQGAEG